MVSDRCPVGCKGLTRLPFLRAMTLKPSCLISCSQPSPEGGRGAGVGRHGAMKPGGKGRGDSGKFIGGAALAMLEGFAPE